MRERPGVFPKRHCPGQRSAIIKRGSLILFNVSMRSNINSDVTTTVHVLSISSPFENCVLRERMRSRISRRINDCAQLA